MYMPCRPILVLQSYVQYEVYTSQEHTILFAMIVRYLDTYIALTLNVYKGLKQDDIVLRSTLGISVV